MSIPEKDWKYASKLRSEFLERLCKRINEQSLKILNDPTLIQHEKCLALYKHVVESDKLIAFGFDDWRRSKSMQCLVFYYQQGLITDLEYSSFTPETKEFITSCLGLEK